MQTKQSNQNGEQKLTNKAIEEAAPYLARLILGAEPVGEDISSEAIVLSNYICTRVAVLEDVNGNDALAILGADQIIYWRISENQEIVSPLTSVIENEAAMKPVVDVAIIGGALS